MNFHLAGLLPLFVFNMIALLPGLAIAADTKAHSNKSCDELTSPEKATPKAAVRSRELNRLRVCADSGNMPLSDIREEGLENKFAETLARAIGPRWFILAPPDQVYNALRPNCGGLVARD